MRYSVLGLSLVTASLVGGRCLAVEEQPKVSIQATVPLMEQIHPGMTRAEVETLLKDRDGGPQSISSTRYYQPPSMIIEVPYDQTGGTWTPTNRVSGNVNIRIGPRSTL